MENAVDALKIAFAVFVFIIAISVSIYMFTMVGETSDIVLSSSDITEFMDYTEISDMIGDDRIVGLETIIPTLYKYYKENYTVIFRNSDGTPMELYETKTNVELWSEGYINKYYDDNEDVRVCSFDVDEETSRHEPWTSNANYYKQNLDMFLSGGNFISPSGNGMDYNYSDRSVNGWGNSSFIDEFKDKRFIETLGKYTYNEITEDTDEEVTSSGLTNVREEKKRVIIYTLLN